MPGEVVDLKKTRIIRELKRKVELSKSISFFDPSICDRILDKIEMQSEIADMLLAHRMCEIRSWGIIFLLTKVSERSGTVSPYIIMIETELWKQLRKKKPFCYVALNSPNADQSFLSRNLTEALAYTGINLDFESYGDTSDHIHARHVVKRVRNALFCVFDVTDAVSKLNLYVKIGISHSLSRPIFHFRRLSMPGDSWEGRRSWAKTRRGFYVKEYYSYSEVLDTVTLMLCKMGRYVEDYR